jgi:Xaa-Pro dipeptidase
MTENLTVQSSELPQFTLAERDRRWSRVRQAMAHERIDLLLAPPHSGHWGQMQADVRYLTECGINMYECFAAFPRVGDVVVVTRMEGHAAWLREAYDWVKDVRPIGGRPWSALVIERMAELGYGADSQARVGVIGYAESADEPEGIMRYDTMASLIEAFPKVQWVSASELVNQVRAVKSAEEVAFIERAGAIADRAVQAMIEHARPGIPAQTLWAHMHAAMLLAGGEYPNMINWDMRPDTGFWPRYPTSRPIEKDDYCINEIDAKFNGYIHQTNHPLYLGKAPDTYRRAFDAVLEAFEAAREAARPGRSVGDMARAAQAAFAKRGVDGHFMLHGRGLGDDLPPLCQGTPADDGILLETGTAFILKPWASGTGASGYQFRMAVGDTCVVTPTGARRLSSHPMELSQVEC